MWFQQWSDMQEAERMRQAQQQAKLDSQVERRAEASAEELRVRALVVALDHAIHQWAEYTDANKHCRNIKLDKELEAASKAILKGLR